MVGCSPAVVPSTTEGGDQSFVDHTRMLRGNYKDHANDPGSLEEAVRATQIGGQSSGSV